MKLAICTVGELFGGVERQVVDLYTYFRDHQKTEPLVILFNDNELADRLRAEGGRPVILAGRFTYDVMVLGRLRRILKEHGIDVVHAHGYKATIACGLVKRQLGFRLVKTEHGKPEASSSPFVRRFKGRANFWLDQIMTRQSVDHVCYVTQDIGSFFEKHHAGLVRSTIHNGIDPLSVVPGGRPVDLPEKGLSLGIVGRISRVKGIPLAIEALENMGSSDPPHLVIIGTGPQSEWLQEMVRSRGLSERIHFLGFKKNIYDYLAHVDALLMPSYHEGLPYTILEAMVLERPIIASNVGGLSECLEDGKSAMLFPGGDVDALRNRIVQFANNPSRAGGLGQKAKQKQLKDFTLAGMCEAYLRVYSGEPGSHEVRN